MEESKIKEFLYFIHSDLEKKKKTLLTYRFMPRKYKIEDMPFISDESELNYLINQCRGLKYLKIEEIGSASSYSLTEEGQKYALK